MRPRTLETSVWLPHPRAEVFAFFSDASNLDRLTPPWLRLRILTPQPLAMQRGTQIDYRILLHFMPIHWRTKITAWDPPCRFVDTQILGPYLQWIHEHDFVERDGGTLMHDRVTYATAGWVLEPVMHRLFVGPDLRRIFAYRAEQIRQIFPGNQP